MWKGLARKPRPDMGWLGTLPLLPLFLVAASGTACRRGPSPALESPVELPEEEPLAVVGLGSSQLARLVSPTDHDLFRARTQPTVFQPTTPSRPESALFGSVRTAASRQGEVPAFHEGVDIAPSRRDRHGRPQDVVRAITDGTVVYVNRTPGNSAYGCYVVLAHADPVGTVYSLYAHLAEVDKEIRIGSDLSAGSVLGRMGATANFHIPLSRAHLHLEIALMANARFPDWFRQQRLKPDHGAYNGWNLLGVDPLDVFEKHQTTETFTFLGYLAQIPVAFEVVLISPKLPDFFHRYPRLWRGQPFEEGALVLACSESGLPLHGRRATDEESRSVTPPGAVLSVNEAVLGPNGLRIVERKGNRWILGSGSRRWLEILLY